MIINMARNRVIIWPLKQLSMDISERKNSYKTGPGA